MIVAVLLFAQVLNTEPVVTPDPMERLQAAFPGIDFNEQCWVLYPDQNTKKLPRSENSSPKANNRNPQNGVFYLR